MSSGGQTRRKKSREDMNDQQKQLALAVEKKALEALRTVSARDASFTDIKEFLRFATELERTTINDDESAADGIHDGLFIKGLFERADTEA